MILVQTARARWQQQQRQRPSIVSPTDARTTSEASDDDDDLHSVLDDGRDGRLAERGAVAPAAAPPPGRLARVVGRLRERAAVRAFRPEAVARRRPVAHLDVLQLIEHRLRCKTRSRPASTKPDRW